VTIHHVPAGAGGFDLDPASGRSDRRASLKLVEAQPARARPHAPRRPLRTAANKSGGQSKAFAAWFRSKQVAEWAGDASCRIDA
jgi:hypothetical protein